MLPGQKGEALPTARQGWPGLRYQKDLHPWRLQEAIIIWRGRSNTARYCAQHAKVDMFDIKTKKCSQRSCIKRASYGTKKRRTAHSMPKMVYSVYETRDMATSYESSRRIPGRQARGRLSITHTMTQRGWKV